MTGETSNARRAFASGLVGASVLAIADAARAAEALTGTSANPPYGCTITGYSKGGGASLASYDCSNRTDVEFVTFALAMEYLQAEFYLNAVQGYGLPASDQGDRAGTVTGGHRVAFRSPLAASFAAEFAVEQQRHVELLRQLIISFGRVPLSRPAIDLQGGFTSIAQQAGLITADQIFTPYKDDINFILGAYLLQDVAVTSYHYLLQQVKSAAVLDKLSGLMAAEAYAAGSIRSTLFGYPSVTNALSYVRSKRDGNAGTPLQGSDHGIGTPAAPTVVVGDGNAIATSRTTQQVQGIFPAGNNGTPGAPFFPSGIVSPP